MNTSKSFSASFHWLNAAQFLGALNDNVFKLFVIFFLVRLLGETSTNAIMFKAGAFFALPFLIFMPWAGWVADRFQKRSIIVVAKGLEIGVMGMGLAGFYLKSPSLLFGTLFLMSAQSALFSPSKYGIIPELVPRDLLSRANGVLVMLTYVAIILGTALAPWVAERVAFEYRYAQWLCVAVAVIGWLCSLGMRPSPAGEGRRPFPWFFLKDPAVTLWSIRRDRFLFLAVLASGYFMLLGAYLQLNMIPYGMQYLGWTQEKSGYLFFYAAVGIAAGALLAGRLSGRNIEFGIVPLGSLLLTVSVVALRFVAPDPRWIAGWVFAAGIGAGLFIIPVDAFIQFRAPRDRMGEILAASGFLGWVGVILAAVLVGLNSVFQWSAAQGFVMMGGLTLALTAVAFWTLPDFFVRFMVLVVTRAICRVRVDGGERIPLEGGALLVCRPMGFLWAAGLVAITQRRIRFIADPAVFRPHPGLRFLMPLLGVIPIALGDTPRRQVEALRAARRALEEGFLVGVFAAPERFAAFESMFQRLMDGGGISVLPVRADARSDAGAGRPGFRRSVNLQIGERLPPETSAATVWAVLGSDPTGAIKTEAASDGPAPGAAGAPGGEA